MDNLLPVLDVIVVNWNSGGLLAACIKSLAKTNTSNFRFGRIVVVDNGSFDNSMDLLNELALGSMPIVKIFNKRNIGFGAACNLGASGSQADYFLFLNPDTEVFESSLNVPIEWMECAVNTGTGIIGIQLLDDSGSVTRTCARFPGIINYINHCFGLNRLMPSLCRVPIMEEWCHNESMIVDHVIGAFMMVRAGLFKDLVGFDERYFVYYEDLDFSYRASQLGYNSMYLVEAQAYHKCGGTSGQVKAERLFYSLRSRIFYGYKHFSRINALMLSFITVVIEPISRCALSLIRARFDDFRHTLRGYIMLWKYLLRY